MVRADAGGRGTAIAGSGNGRPFSRAPTRPPGPGLRRAAGPSAPPVRPRPTRGARSRNSPRRPRRGRGGGESTPVGARNPTCHAPRGEGGSERAEHGAGAREAPSAPPVDEVDVGIEAGQRTLRPPPVTGEHPVPGRGKRRRRVLSHPVPGRHEDREHALAKQGFEPFAPFAHLFRRDPSRRILRFPIAGRGVIRVGETVHEHVHRIGQHAGEGGPPAPPGMTARPSGQPGRTSRRRESAGEGSTASSSRHQRVTSRPAARQTSTSRSSVAQPAVTGEGPRAHSTQPGPAAAPGATPGPTRGRDRRKRRTPARISHRLSSHAGKNPANFSGLACAAGSW